MNSNLKTIQAIYQAFGKGDIPTIISHLSDKVQWEHWSDNSSQKAGTPWMKARKDKAGVAAFFEVVGQLQIKDFQVLSLMEGGNQVAAEFFIEFVYPATGKTVRDEEMHLWTFDDHGKVIRLRHYTDTHKHMAAAGVALEAV